jgi:endonuclease-3
LQMNSHKVKRCIEVLERIYGIPEPEEQDPLDLLILTILSQNTTDVNSLRAFRLLKSAYPRYQDLINAPLKDVEEKIRVGGLAEIKSQRIVEVLRMIQKDCGAFDLRFLAGMTKEDADQYLQSLPGVGPKTSSVVLLFSFGFAALPVDTHVFRVSRRLGLVPEEAGIAEAQRILEAITPQEKYFSLHLNLIRHGRRVCRARGPLHQQCELREICDHYLQGRNP